MRLPKIVLLRITYYYQIMSQKKHSLDYNGTEAIKLHEAALKFDGTPYLLFLKKKQL
jgi:hypothetical protein